MEDGRDELSECLFDGGEDTQELVNQGASVKVSRQERVDGPPLCCCRGRRGIGAPVDRAGADIYLRSTDGDDETAMDCLGSHEGICRLMHRAADRRHCVWIAIVRKRAASGGDVGTLFSQPRRSKRLPEGQLSGAIKFLVRGAPVEVFCAVVGFL